MSVSCDIHKTIEASHSLKVEEDLVLYVCTPCYDHLLTRDGVRCKFCFVPMVGRHDPTPSLSNEPHKPDCPRHS